MTVARGLVVNAQNAFPSMQEITALRPQYLRSIVYGNDAIEAALQDVPPGVRFIALMSAEHEEIGSDLSGWEPAIQSFAQRFKGRVWGVELEREWDLNGNPASQIADLIHVASPYLLDAGMKRIAGAVAGVTWQSALISLANLVDPDAYDFGGFHPYGQRIASMGDPQPGFGPGLAESIIRARSLLRKPIAVTEFGAKIVDYGDEARQAEYVTQSFAQLDTLDEATCPLACYFAWHDGVGSPDEQGVRAFGLVRADDSKRPAWAAFERVTQEIPEEDPMAEFVLGFKDVADANPDIVGNPLEDEWGATQGISQQETDTGTLTWANLVEGQAIVFKGNDGKRYLWDGSALQEVAA